MSAMRKWIGANALLWPLLALAQPPQFLDQGGMQPGLHLQPATSLSQPMPAAPQPTPLPGVPREDRKIDESVFGARLFLGRFAQQSFRGFNPDYLISAGDWIDLKLWGAAEAQLRLQVDSQGNIFVPKLGPVRVLNVRNGALNTLVTQRIKQVYRDNVGVYAALANAEPVKVFVTGNVVEPGLYGAYASDSILHFLDRAGGIDTDTGSFLDIRVLRAGKTVRALSLYDFLLRGELPLIQFQDGDTIVVGPRRAVARVTGLVQKALQFEFSDEILLSDLLQMAGIDEMATHVQIVHNQTPQRHVEYLALNDTALQGVKIVSGDEVSVHADRQVATVIARVEGEYEGVSQYVLPYDATLGQLLERVATTPKSNLEGIQLYRSSIARRQKEVLEQMLEKLEQSVLSARSGTREEAELRAREAELVLKFIERARDVEPKGRLVLHAGFDPASIDLQDRDLIKIPRKANTVAVQGEVYFPSSFAFQQGKSVDEFIEMAGGLTQKGDSSRVFVLRPNGEMERARSGLFSSTRLQPGDEILVLPQIDSKEFQFSKDLVQIIYQLALSAGVVLAL